MTLEDQAMTLLPEVRQQLLDAAARRSRTRRLGVFTLPRAGRRWRRTPLIALLGAVVLGGGAFATVAIQLGAPAPKSRVQLFTAPRTGDGALSPGSVRMLPISTPDPAGGAPWGMREFATSRGLGCIEVARLYDGKLVGLGQDYAFGDDGRYHELSVASGGAGYGDWCSALDQYHRLYINQMWGEQPASAWQSRCYAPGSPPGGHMRKEPECPPADERNLYFGLLGPDAKSITYVLEGQRHTIATRGPEGAYLIVMRSTPHQLLTGVGDGRRRPRGRSHHRNSLPRRRHLPHHLAQLDRWRLRLHAEPAGPRRLRRSQAALLHPRPGQGALAGQADPRARRPLRAATHVQLARRAHQRGERLRLQLVHPGREI